MRLRDVFQVYGTIDRKTENQVLNTRLLAKSTYLLSTYTKPNASHKRSIRNEIRRSTSRNSENTGEEQRYLSRCHNNGKKKRNKAHIKRQPTSDEIGQDTPCISAEDQAGVQGQGAKLDANGVELLLHLREDDGDAL
jgi:hypothetical protein